MVLERYTVPRLVRQRAFIDREKYLKWYEESVENPDKTKVKNTSFTGKV